MQEEISPQQLSLIPRLMHAIEVSAEQHFQPTVEDTCAQSKKGAQKILPHSVLETFILCVSEAHSKLLQD